jgi:sarcosine oxidase subunit alpha
VLRNVAGLGRLDARARRSRRRDVEHRRAEVLVVGGGRAGRSAAARWSARGKQVVLVDEGLCPPLNGVEVLSPARAIGVYEGGLVPVDAGDLLYRFRAERIVIATGALEQPLVFPGNDLVGVMLPSAVRMLVAEWAIKPGERAVVVTADDAGLHAAERLSRIGTDVARVVDLRARSLANLAAKGRRGLLRAVTIEGEEIGCDLLVMSGGRQPAYSLLAQAGASVAYDSSRGIFVPTDNPENVEMVGAAAGEVGASAVPAAAYGEGSSGKRFVCFCEDVTDKDMKRSIAEGFDSLELSKRYTTVTMGPCQGRLCQLASIRACARHNGQSEESIGTTTARPPWAPVSLGVLAGRPHEPARRTSLHHRHVEAGAAMMWTGTWRRPHSYGDPAGEAKAVHESLGIIDVSTLGKMLVVGSEAGALLDRLYPNRLSNLGPGRLRYGVIHSDGGRIMDDGTIARLDEKTFYVTTTSTGGEAVLEWFEWWNAIWQLDAEVIDVTGALAAINVAGPRARDLMARVTDIDMTNGAFKYLDAKEGVVAGVPALVLRIGFVGELGYEIHLTSPCGEYLWDTLLERGADLGVRPFGLEPQRILRLEKMHILVGQDTDSESSALGANMPWIVKLDKDDFVGKRALEHVAENGVAERLVGFEMSNGVVPAEGGQIVLDGRPGGRVTSARFSPELRRAIGMAWVPSHLAREDAEICIRVDGRLERAHVRLRPFFDPEGARLRA